MPTSLLRSCQGPWCIPSKTAKTFLHLPDRGAALYVSFWHWNIIYTTQISWKIISTNGLQIRISWSVLFHRSRSKMVATASLLIRVSPPIWTSSRQSRQIYVPWLWALVEDEGIEPRFSVGFQTWGQPLLSGDQFQLTMWCIEKCDHPSDSFGILKPYACRTKVGRFTQNSSTPLGKICRIYGEKGVDTPIKSHWCMLSLN